MNVCEQIMYHLMVFKPPMRENAENVENGFAFDTADFFQPPWLDQRRRTAALARQSSLLP